MIKPNWGAFKAKFSENPQVNFEWFCYLLFCKEYNQPNGIVRFKNQSGMETNPIKVGDQHIAWEAKFYEDKLSTHKDEFIKKIKIAKQKNPELTQILFYTPIDWTESSKKTKRKTTEQENIENDAKSKNIEIIWKGASFFESEFVAINNEHIVKYFFTLNNSNFDFIQEQKNHTENILNDIQTSIAFNSQTIEINRDNELDKIKTAEQKILILSGAGGVGKTAIIKTLYEEIVNTAHLYVFKATEFELRNINDLFKSINVKEFIDFHKDEITKIIVIDSAEKLLDLKNTDPFKEFLSMLIKDNWKIIFTTRDNYLNDLNYQFSEIYNIVPLNINLQNLSREDLNIISDKYSFQLPQNEKLLDLIKNPFYLNEYLRFYIENEQLDYESFKTKLWDKTIRKSKPSREQAFLKIAFQRANEGQFFLHPDCESHILDDELTKDGILGYETSGYFITHDIYEEWALEKIIEIEFNRSINYNTFFEKIGQSLPIRRSFRNWLSEKLLLENEAVKKFIEESITDNKIEQYWKNEILVSVLLSDYSAFFFKHFKELLLKNKQELLKTISFWLRITCKEVDEDFFKQLGIRNVDLYTLKYILTKPKGEGWKSIIKFVFENLEAIGIENINFILPVISDWNNKYKTGEATKYSSLIALKYYQWTIEKDVFFSHDDLKDKIIQTILYGSFEIKNELKEVIEKILKNKWKFHREPYYDLSKTILTKLEGISVSQVHPELVLQLADLYWSHTPKKGIFYSQTVMGTEQYFDMEDDYLEYFPASSYQTPIYWLLQFAIKDTVAFILDFTNRTVEYYAKSDFAKPEVEEIEVSIGDNKTIKQYISKRLWCIYRGTQVAPHALESMHMALEKFFLEIGKKSKHENLEYWLLYLLKNSKSASISAVVASIVLAFPDKTFNVAKILFQTKEFFRYDTNRLILDHGQKSSLLSLKNFSISSKNDFHEDERLKACDDIHRKSTLENLCLNYQCFRNKDTEEQEAENRQKIIWKILDNYYANLPPESEQTESDETWRMYLARMDRRKMNPVAKTKDNCIEIDWNPEVDPKLKKKKESFLQEISEEMKYNSLNMWGRYKIKNDEQYKQYIKYEQNPKLALKEVKQIISKLKSIESPKVIRFNPTKDESFYFMNYSIPGDVCAVLIRDYYDKLSSKDIGFCKNIIYEVASSSFNNNYQYQASDGVDSAISVLPLLLEKFPKDGEIIKIILLITLFDHQPIGMNEPFSNYSLKAILNNLWKASFNDAQSILFGYLVLESKYEDLRKKLQEESYKNGIYGLNKTEFIESFLKENENVLQKVVSNVLLIKDLPDIEIIELASLKTAFQLIPLRTNDKDHKKITLKIISAFAKKLISDDRNNKVDYNLRHGFLEKLAYFTLSANKEDIEDYLKPFIDNFNNSEAIAELLKEFVLAEDYLDTYDNFWVVWNLFKEKVIEICSNGFNNWIRDKIVESYLFAQVTWKDTAIDWHTLKDRERKFFKEITEKIGNCSSTLYSISKLLNGIGSSYLNDGIFWISEMIKKNKNLYTDKLEVNTIYYMENIVRKYFYNNREQLKKTKKLKDDILVILDFLIIKDSVIGYILRESIL